MNFKEYKVGLVAGAVGINDAQTAEIKSRVAFYAKALGPEGKVVLHLLGFSDDVKNPGLPTSVTNLAYVAGVRIEILPAGKGGRLWGRAFHTLLDCDEVWCCPDKHISQVARTRVARVYQAGSRDSQNSRKFKIIPPWVEMPQAASQKVKKSKQAKKRGVLNGVW